MSNTTYAPFIKQARLDRGFSQQDLAEKVGISRTQYISVEQGKRELTIGEFEKISTLLGISLADIDRGQQANYEKYKQMILQFLRFSLKSPIKKTKLAKLTYLADFAWYYENLKSMSGMEYRRIKFGPVPDAYFSAIEELEESGKIRIDRELFDGRPMYSISELESNKIQKLSAISNEEVVLMKKIYSKWANKNVSEIVNFTHEQLPYKICSPDEVIPYELITQEDPEHVY